MENPAVHVMGSLVSGLIIEADRPAHLNPSGRLPRQSMVLTPAQAKELLRQVVAMNEKPESP